MAYTRRRRFEARLLAKELAEMMGSGMATAVNHPLVKTGNGRSDHVHADVLLREMGVTIQ